MRRALKILSALLAIALILAGGLAANVLWFKPVTINLFFERVFLQFALDDPELLSSLRLLESFGLNFHNDDLTDASPARARRLLAKAKKDRATLQRYDRSDLDANQKMSYDILDYFLKQNIDGEAFLYYDYPVNQLFGVQNDLPDFMVNIHQVNNVQDAENYIARLGKFDAKFAQLLDGLRLRQEKGIVPPKFVIVRVLKEMEGFVGDGEAETNLLYTAFAGKLAEAGIAGEEKSRLLAEAVTAINESLFPAYASLTSFLTAQKEIATLDDGVWKFPGGEAFYTYILHNQTTTDMTPEEIHQTGLRETERIQNEMDGILSGLGHTEGSVGDRMAALAKDPAYLFPDTDAGREACLEGYREIIAEVDQGINAVFDMRPAASVAVERVPEFREAGSAGAYYNMPALDGSRPGTFYANLRDMREIPKFGMRTLAYHEAIPGHHFQIAIQQELPGPTFRKMPLFTAYTEGWALYAEYLAWEQGFQDDPLDNLGRLQAELFRAVRLVVDTGIHYKRWQREQAIAYMEKNTGMPLGDVTAEIERYIVNPGQACAYKIGMLKILQLREHARAELGDAFDIKEFHNRVLMNGALPLDILSRVIEDYIADSRPAAQVAAAS